MPCSRLRLPPPPAAGAHASSRSTGPRSSRRDRPRGVACCPWRPRISQTASSRPSRASRASSRSGSTRGSTCCRWSFAARPCSGALPPRRAVARFCRGIVDAVAPYVVAVKPQAAFFEALGSDGMRALEEVCAHARSVGLLVLLDAKRGDIGSTARGYAEAYLEPRDDGAPTRRCDHREPVPRSRLGRAVPRRLPAARRRASSSSSARRTPAPRTSRTRRSPTAVRCGSTSPTSCGSGASRTSGESGMSSVGAVVGATHPRAVSEARRLLPRSPLLLPGVGAQGATPADVARAFTTGAASALVTASRSVIYAYRDTELDWREARPRRGRAPRRAGLGRLRLVSAATAPRSASQYSSGPVMRRALLASVALVAAFAGAGWGTTVRALEKVTRRVSPRPRGTSSARTGPCSPHATRRRQRAIASITKLMTALVVLERARLSDVVR